MKGSGTMWSDDGDTARRNRLVSPSLRQPATIRQPTLLDKNTGFSIESRREGGTKWVLVSSLDQSFTLLDDS